jgi:hypothetical protein
LAWATRAQNPVPTRPNRMPRLCPARGSPET